MPIFPLPQFEADLAQDRVDREAYEKLSVPKTVVVRFGSMKMVGEFPFNLNVKPGCGTKMVARTHRGTELAEMLTSTCPNAGCSKSVTRKEMLEYIENSGGKDYPYFNDGSIIRIATTDDLNEQRRIEGLRQGMQRFAQSKAVELGLAMKVVDAEPILGGERLTFFYTSEDRVDFRELVTVLSQEYPARIEMRQVGARDEARLIADYEKCGQHCCCKQFLKVLKPISMKSAKIQKATLDPLKISGRCGRLMCCLRYEDETYETLRKRLPKMKARVTTPEGIGTVVDAQILTQLVLVVLDADDKRIAVPVENITLGAPPYVPPELRGPGGGSGGGRGPGGGGSSEPRAPGRGQGPAGAPPRAPRSEPPQGRRPEGSAPVANEDPLRGMSAEEIARKTGGVAPPRDDRQGEFRDRSKRDGSGGGGGAPARGGEGREPRRDDRREGGGRDARRDDGRGGGGGNREGGGGPRHGGEPGRREGGGGRGPDRGPDRGPNRGPGGGPGGGGRQGPPRPPVDAGPVGAGARPVGDVDGDDDGPDEPDVVGGAGAGTPGAPAGGGAPRADGGGKRRRRRRRRGGGPGGGGPGGGGGSSGPPAA
jgi:cell fate regulator YaaT (PSP1 superfamily)